MPLSPVPNQAATWTKGNIITTSQLRADITNLSQLKTSPPMFLGQQLTTGSALFGSSLTLIPLDAENIDNYFGHTLNNAPYSCGFPGWYLVEGGGTAGNAALTAGFVATGIRAVQLGTTTDLFGNILAQNAVNTTGGIACDLIQLDPVSATNLTADTVSLIMQQTVTGAGVSIPVVTASLSAEWVAMPTTLSDQTSGTVVASPQLAALWPPGTGTTITNVGGIAAGATSMTVGSATGMLTGGTLGLDYYEGQALVPTAEAVNITSVVGLTIGISATKYPHGGTATPGMVAVPVSAVFMNQQVRDIVNFLAYPPIVKLSGSGSTQSVPSQTFPAGTAVSFGTAVSAHGVVVDNFGGWSNTNPTRYTIQVGGVYTVYGQTPMSPAVGSNISAGLAISGGTIQWGDSVRQQNAASNCPVVRKMLRLTAGQYIELYTSQSTGGGQTMSIASNSYPTLVAVWRGF